MTRITWLKFGCIIMLAGLLGCSSSESPELKMQNVSIYTDVDANQNSATAVDLVLIYDSQLVQVFGKMPAEQYFKNSDQLKRDNPATLDIWHWELVPGQNVESFEPTSKGKAFAGYVFANYITPGEHRVRVQPNGEIKVILLKDDIKDSSIIERIKTPSLTPSQSVIGEELERAEQTRNSTVHKGYAADTNAREAEPSGVQQATESYANYEDPEVCNIREEVAMEVKSLQDTCNEQIPFKISPAAQAPCDLAGGYRQ